MALNAYLQQTQLLLGDPKEERFNLDDLKTYVNTARGQVAAEGECIKVVGNVSTVAAQRFYNFTSISVASVAGASYVLTCRQIAGNGILLTLRPWEWFFDYSMPVSVSGNPTTWAQFGQGSSGSFALDPIPGVTVITLIVDAIAVPIALVDDTTAEAVPYPFTDAVPYFAAYMALLTSGDEQRAQAMYQGYERFMYRARIQSTPSVLPSYYPGAEAAKITAQQMPLVNPATIGQQ